MARFLLVHGSCHGAWCWRDLLPLLHEAGHEATAIDLPSHGQDRTPVADVTLDLYAERIADALTTLGGEVILVGHSMAGYPITAAAARAEARIARLVYLCAYVPMQGKALADMRRMAASQPLLDAIHIAPDRLSFTVDPAKAGDRFYHDVPPETAAWAIGQLGPQPILPQETPLSTFPGPDLPRSYIRCLQDRTIPPAFQVTMTESWPAADVHTLESSHSPFLSAPADLAALLTRIAA